jgi:hypothetical protein
VPNLSTTASVGGYLTSVNTYTNGYPTVVSDPSYFDWLGVHNQSTYTRCTDARSLQEKLNANVAEGIGGSSLYQLVNANSTLLAMDAAKTVVTTVRTDPLGNKFCAAPTYGGGPADYITCGASCVPGTATRSASIAITNAMNLTSPGVNTSSYNFGSPDFDLTDPSEMWAWGPSGFNSSPTIVTGPILFGGTNQHLPAFSPDGSFTYPYTGGQSIGIVDFYYALPMGTASPEHIASHAYTLGQYVQHTMYLAGSATPELYLYAISTTYPAGALIQPGSGGDGILTNPQNCAFKAAAAGTTGGTVADFKSLNPCVLGTLLTTVTDGGVTWISIGVGGTGTSGQNGPAFILHDTTLGSNSTAGGTFAPYKNGGSTACTNAAPCVNPDIASSITDGGVTWVNSGPNLGSMANLVAQGNNVNLWNVTAGVSQNNKKFGMAFSTNTYGPNTSGSYSFKTTGQGTAQWALEADLTDPVSGKPTFYTLNTTDGIQTNETCSGLGLGSTGAAANLCGSTTWTTPVSASFPNGSAFYAMTTPSGVVPIVTANGCFGGIHNEKVWITGNMVTINILPSFAAFNCSDTYHFFEWFPRGPSDDGTFDPYINLQTFQAGVPHYALGNTSVWADAGSGGGYGGTSGVITSKYPNTNTSGNSGGLPVRCGSGIYSSGNCLICSPSSNSCPSQPVFVPEPYTFSIGPAPPGSGSSCSLSTITNTGYPGNGMQPNVYGIFTLTPGGAQSGAPPCNVANIWDWHFDDAYNPGLTDNSGWLIGTVNNSTQFLPYEDSPWEGEVTGYQQASCGQGTVVTCGTQKRFGHSMTFGTSTNFSVNVQTSSGAIDGTFVALGSDWYCAFGSTVGPPSLTTTYVPYMGMPTTVLALCGPPWQPSYSYVVGNLMSPIKAGAAQAGTGGLEVYQATTVSGPSSALVGGAIPAALYAHFLAGDSPVTDNGVTWTIQVGGANPDGRGDVVLITER